MRFTPILGLLVGLLAATGLRALAPPTGTSLLFTLPAQPGIVEGIAHRTATGEYFLSDVHQRSVWRRAADGALTRFTPADDRLFGVFGIAVDERRQRLWAATSMLAVLAQPGSPDAGAAALVALDLDSGALLGVYPVPDRQAEHTLGDLVLAAGGSLYATDSSSPTVWRLAPGAESLEPFLTSPEFRSLQGIAVLDAGHLVISDYASGLFVVNLVAKTHHRLRAPADTSLRGIDGIAARDRALVAVYNATEPNRVLRLQLSADLASITRAETLYSASPGFGDLTLVTLVGDRPVIIAQSGWASLDSQKPPAPAPHDVHVLQFGPLE